MFLHGVRGIARVNDQATFARLLRKGIASGMTYTSEVGHGLQSLTGQGTFGISVPPVAPQGATFSERGLGKKVVPLTIVGDCGN
jgi:hypothetical protein